MQKKRVVITGLGIVSSVGNDVQKAWHSIKNGISGVDYITRFNAANCVTQIAGEVRNFNTTDFMSDKDARRVDFFIRYGVVAGVQAINDSGIETYPHLNKNRVGLLIGSGIGGLSFIEENALIINNCNSERRVSPFFITGTISNMIGGHLSIMFGYSGVNFSISSACATGNHALGTAMQYIQNNSCDIVIAGGAEATISATGIAGFNANKALSTNNSAPQLASRPWDRNRDGFVMSEGAGVLVLEDYEHAKTRNAKIYAEICGYSANSDAHHITTPNLLGAVNSMRYALASAQLDYHAIDYINAHGTSTKVGDLNETLAIKECFADHATNLAISSTKSMTGHALGAASAIEAIFSVLALYDGIIPPTINLVEADEHCDLDYVPHNARECKNIKYVLSNAFGFGGTNSSIILGKL